LPGDCLDRWLLLRETGTVSMFVILDSLLNDVYVPEKPLASTPTPMITRGLKRPANTSLIGINTSGSPASVYGFESKKRRRHYLMYETIRKAARKRELEKKSSCTYISFFGVPITHDTCSSEPKKAFSYPRYASSI
jgi:chromatin modification-related protein VID21